MRRMLALVAPLLAVGVAAQPLYDFGESSLLKIDDSNFESAVLKDETAVWVVEYYADWCGHCKAFAKGFQKAADNLKGMVKFGAVNADNAKKTVQAAGVQGYPTIKLYVPGTGSRNPYTGKFYKPAVDYNGPRTAKGVVDFATATVPSLVVPVTDKSLSKFKGNGTLPKALLFTKKAETPLMLKAISVALNERMLLGEARETAEKAVSEFGITDFPTLVVLPSGEGATPIKYDGELKPAAVSAFLASHAAAAPEKPSGDEAAAASGPSAPADDLSVEVTAANVADVEGERDAWVLVFAGSETADLPAPGVAGLAEALYGQAKVGRVAAALADKFGVKTGAAPVTVVWPFRTPGVKRKASKPFEPTDEGVAAAKKAALDTLPDSYVEKLSQANLQQFMQMGMQSTDAKASVILFSDKPQVAPLFRALSLTFEGKLAFGMAQASDRALAQQFNVQKAPTLLVMYPDESKVDEKTGQTPLTGMQFMPQMHGKFNYPNIAQFLAQAVMMRTKDTPSQAPGGSGGSSGGGAAGGGGSGGSSKAGPIEELSAEAFDALCTSKGGLCAIALLDGAPENANKDAHLEMLTKLKKRKAGGPLAFSWLDATCHPAFAVPHWERAQ